MLQYQLDQLDVFFFYDVGKKIYRPPSMMFDIHFFLHKRGRVISLGSENEICLIILHYCQIRGPPHPMTFTSYDGFTTEKVYV